MSHFDVKGYGVRVLACLWGGFNAAYRMDPSMPKYFRWGEDSLGTTVIIRSTSSESVDANWDE